MKLFNTLCSALLLVGAAETSYASNLSSKTEIGTVLKNCKPSTLWFPRTGVNPVTGKKMDIPAKKVAKFRPGCLFNNYPTPPFNLSLLFYGAVPIKGNELMWAVAENNLEDVKKWCSGVKNIDNVSAAGINPLQLAARNGFLEIVKFLIEEKGAQIDFQKNVDDRTPLSWACTRHNAIAQYLIEKGADALKTNGWWAPIKEAVEFGSLDTVKLLIEKAKVPVSQKLLHKACFSGRIKIIEYLLQKGAKANQPNNKGFTPIDTAKNCYRNDKVAPMLELLKKYTN